MPIAKQQARLILPYLQSNVEGIISSKARNKASLFRAKRETRLPYFEQSEKQGFLIQVRYFGGRTIIERDGNQTEKYRS